MTTELVESTPDLELMERADAPAIWSEYRSKFEELKSSVDSVLSSDPSLPANAKIARVNRLELRQIRIAVENKRKELGEGLLRKKQSIDNAAKELKTLIEPYEAKLLEIEEHAERVEEERLRKLTAGRTEQLSKFTTISAAVNYGALSDEEFDKMLADAKAIHEMRQAESKRLEEERIAREKAEAEERERIRKENERLKAEAEAREKEAAAEREKARKERKALEAKAKAEREELERKAAAERQAAEEAARKEREAREKVEAELAAKKKAEQEKLAAAEAARKEAELAPDREKLAAFAAAVRSLPVPSITSKRGQEIISQKIEEFALWVEAASKSLKAK